MSGEAEKQAALEELLLLAVVSFEGDPWYAEHEGLDGEAILARARSHIEVQADRESPKP